MNSYDLMSRIGFGDSSIPFVGGQFVTSKSIVDFTVKSTNGTTLTVDWDDGTLPEDFAMTGADVAVGRNYGSSSQRGISFSGTGNVPMTDFDCDNNDFTSIDVSENTSLTFFSLDGNVITSIDVSDLIVLESLSGSSCGLTSIDISLLTALDTVFLQGNNFTSIDISNNVLLIQVQFQVNNLTSTEVNSHLAQLVANGLSNGGYISSLQDPVAPPTGQGITDKATLITRGWTVTTD